MTKFLSHEAPANVRKLSHCRLSADEEYDRGRLGRHHVRATKECLSGRGREEINLSQETSGAAVTTDSTSRRSFLQAAGGGIAALWMRALATARQQKPTQGFEETPTDPDEVLQVSGTGDSLILGQ